MKTKMKVKMSANCLQKLGQHAVKWSEMNMSGILGLAAAGPSRNSAPFQVVSGTKKQNSASGGSSMMATPTQNQLM